MACKTKKSRNSSKSDSDLSCDYCEKSFVRESSLFKHTCEPKRRFLDRDKKENHLGFAAFTKWNLIAMGKKHEIEYTEFIKSKYYTSFVKFGKFINEAKITNWQIYLEWLIQNQTAINKWYKDSTYNESRREISKRETPERAVERFVVLADRWAQENNDHWSNYWQNASMNLIIFHIQSGKLSPWVIFGSNKAQQFLDSVPDELFLSIIESIDIDYWKRKTKLFKKDLEWISQLID